MNARIVLHECRRRGISVRLDGDDVRFRGPADGLTAELVECARRLKPELVALLVDGRKDRPPPPSPDFSERWVPA